jgi:PDZ domain-containing protein
MKEKLLNFIKLNYKNLIFIFVVIIMFYMPTNYEIDTDGGLIDLNDRITVDPSYDSTGSINLTYVGGIKGTPAMLLLSYILPSWDAYKYTDYLIDDETYDEQLKRYKVSLIEAEQNATYVALKSANKDVEIKSYNVTVIFIDKDAITSLEVGDVILDVEGDSVLSFENLGTIIDTHEVGDIINIKVKRDNKEKTVTATIREEDENKIVGIYINPIIELETKIDVTFQNEAQEYGSSGGLMNTLMIYEKVTEEDITKGRIISGTGSINIDGTVEEISGVKYKLRGAYKNGADIFIVPEANYEEALEVQKEYDMDDIKIIEAINFNQVLEELKK